MESRKVTAKVSTAPGPAPALRARTRRIIDPSSPTTTTASPVPRPATTQRAASARDVTATILEGLASRRAVVRASTSVVGGRSGPGSDVGVRARVSSPVPRSDVATSATKKGTVIAPLRTTTPTARVGTGVSARRDKPLMPSPVLRAAPTTMTTTTTTLPNNQSKQDSAPRIPLPTSVRHSASSRIEQNLPQADPSRPSYFDPTSPRAVTSLRREDHAVPLVSPRSGRREAGRKARAAVEAVDRAYSDHDDMDGIFEAESSVSSASSSSAHSSSRSTGSSAEEEEEPPPPTLPPLVISAEIRRQILDEEDAKRSRKIADLEISNTSLMSINRTLEADVARLNRLIAGMKRQLRASGHVIPPQADTDPGESSDTTSSFISEAPAARRASIDAALETSKAHTDALRAMNEQLGRLVQRGRTAVERVDGMTEGGKGKVLSGWEVGEGEEAEREEGRREGDDVWNDLGRDRQEQGGEEGHNDREDGDGAVD